MTVTPDTLDLSPLNRDDLLNLVLQRSDVLGYNRPAFDKVRDWEAGEPAALEAAVAENGETYAREAARLIHAEFDRILGLLKRLQPRRIADIGCGYGIFDLFAYHALDCDILLIDIEQSERRHFGFEDEGAGYSSLATARALLTANGVPGDRIVTWNPNREDLPDGPPIDLAVSFLSCGFHYPIDMYMPFFELAVAPKGAVILDLRGGQADAMVDKLELLGRVRVLRQGGGIRQVLLKKQAGT